MQSVPHITTDPQVVQKDSVSLNAPVRPQIVPVPGVPRMQASPPRQSVSTSEARHCSQGALPSQRPRSPQICAAGVTSLPQGQDRPGHEQQAGPSPVQHSPAGMKGCSWLFPTPDPGDLGSLLTSGTKRPLLPIVPEVGMETGWVTHRLPSPDGSWPSHPTPQHGHFLYKIKPTFQRTNP